MLGAFRGPTAQRLAIEQRHELSLRKCLIQCPLASRRGGADEAAAALVGAVRAGSLLATLVGASTRTGALLATLTGSEAAACCAAFSKRATAAQERRPKPD